MKIHQDGSSMGDDNIQRYFKEGDPKYDPDLNSKTYESIPTKAKIEVFRDLKKEEQYIIQNVILPAVNDISQYALNEPEKAREAIKKVMENKLFRFHYWDDDDNVGAEDNNNDNDKMVELDIEEE
jgi:hypothetical protein